MGNFRELNTSESGFTIIEIIVAMVLFVAVLPAIASMVISIDYVNKTSRDYEIVNGLALEKIEGLRSEGFDNLTDGTTYFTNELPGSLSPPNSGSYEISTESSSVKKIELTISYTAQGQSRSYSYTTLISDNGLGQ